METYLEVIAPAGLPPILPSPTVWKLHWGGPKMLSNITQDLLLGFVGHHTEEEIVFVGDAIVLNQPPILANADLIPWIDNLKSARHEIR
jgi:hypothetical protein